MFNVRLLACAAASMLLGACATSTPASGPSRLPDAHRQRLVESMGHAAMRYHQCERVDSVTSSVLSTNELVPGMRTLMQPEGSSTERWVTRVCGKEIENTVYRGRLLNGGQVTLVRGCSGPGAMYPEALIRFAETGNGLSELFASSLEKWNGHKGDLTGPASALVPLMTCTASPAASSSR